MKLRNLFYALLALPLVFAACEELGGEATPSAVQFTVTSELTAEFKATAGTGAIFYTLTNAPEDARPTATCADEWVNNFDVTASMITYKVSANTEEATRTTEIVVSYKEQEYKIAVSQEGKAAASKAPKLEVTSGNMQSFDFKETIGTIEFSLENPIEGVDVVASANVDWITNFAVAETTVSFLVAANEGEAREGKITLTYGALDPVVVDIAQAAYVPAVPALVIYSTDSDFMYDGGTGEISFGLENLVEFGEVVVTCDAEWITFGEVTFKKDIEENEGAEDNEGAEGNEGNEVSPASVADEVKEGYIPFTVAANEGENMREATVTLTCGELTATTTIKQLQNGFNPNFTYSTFSITECWASCENGGTQWNVTFVEHDDNKGDMYTRISFGLAEANVQRIPDGTYSVENGSILVNTASLNGCSTYRYNTSDTTDITAANFTVTTDTEKKVITIEGTFQAATNVVNLNYTGAMAGMDLGEIVSGAIEHTEWASCTKGWTDTKQMIINVISADGSLEIMFDVRHTGGTKALPEGTYCSLWPKKDNGRDYINWTDLEEQNVLNPTSKCIYNNVDAYLKNDGSSSLIVEKVDGCYKFTYDLTDELDRHFTGVIQATW